MSINVREPETPQASSRPQPRRRWLVAAGLVLAVVLGATWWAGRPVDVRAGTDAVTVDEMAGRYGVDVNLIAVTARGGLIELRYQVVDPDKATRLLHDEDLAPILIAEDTEKTLRMAAPPHKHGAELRVGGQYFFLMANVRNALHEGSQVTLIIGDARLEHLTVQG
jgi:hypothetical protein